MLLAIFMLGSVVNAALAGNFLGSGHWTLGAATVAVSVMAAGCAIVTVATGAPVIAP